jgi:hypothetical protein
MSPQLAVGRRVLARVASKRHPTGKCAGGGSSHAQKGGDHPKRKGGSSPIHDVSPARVGVTRGMYSDSNWRSVWHGNVTTAGRPE